MYQILKLKRQSLHLDYFRDYKDRICQVLTWHHPEDKKLSIVKYKLGNSYWTSRETGLQYERILKSYSLEGHQDNLELVSEFEKDYLYFSKVYGVNFLAVPNDKIKCYFYPEDRLQEILTREEQNDEIESKVKILAELLHDKLKIPFENMGISGSIVWKAQTEKSDIDFMIYGNKYAKDFNDKFPIIYDVSEEIKPMNEDKTSRYTRSMSKKSGLPFELCKKYISKKTWLSMFGKTNLSMLFSPTTKELPFSYGDEIFKPICPVEIECTIKRDDLGSAYPGIYKIENPIIISELNNQFRLSIERILSFEGALIGYFKEGDKIIVRGLLEEVNSTKTTKSFGQVLLGTKECNGNEFILLKEDYMKYKQKIPKF